MGSVTARQNISSGRPTEALAGYSRAVRVGNVVHVSGTTGTDQEGRVTAVRDMYGQTKKALENIRWALEASGARMEDVVRTRTYVTDMDRWEDAARAHGEWFARILPASTLVGVTRLVHPDMLVEIEAEAIIPERP